MSKATARGFKLRKDRGWRMQLARHGTELANVLALAHFDRVDTPWELMRSDAFQQVVAAIAYPGAAATGMRGICCSSCRIARKPCRISQLSWGSKER